MTKLAQLIKAKRSDLLDGFPLKAALKALTSTGSLSFKKDYLNKLLEAERIEIISVKPDKHLMPGFREAGIVGGLTFSDGSIEIKVDDSFFNSKICSPIVRGLRFQSIVAHELVHRKQFSTKTLQAVAFCSDDELTSIEYLNDPFELEAMAAEVVHDSVTSVFTASDDPLSQPRFTDLSANAKYLRPESMVTFSDSMASLKT
jgi:hypothetical protein